MIYLTLPPKSYGINFCITNARSALDRAKFHLTRTVANKMWSCHKTYLVSLFTACGTGLPMMPLMTLSHAIRFNSITDSLDK